MADLYGKDFFLKPEEEDRDLYGRDFFLQGTGFGVPYTPPPEEDEGSFFQRLLGEAQDFFGAKKEWPEEGTFHPQGIESGGTIPPAEVYPPQAQAASPAPPTTPMSAKPQAVPTTPLVFPGTPLNTLPQANPAPQESIAQMPPGLVGERRGYKPGDIPKAIGGSAEAIGSTIWNTGIGALGGVLGVLSLPYGIDEAVKNMQGFQKDLGYSPHSEMGKAAEKVIQYPFKELHKWALKQGDETFRRWGSPFYAAAVATAVDLLPMIFMKAPAEISAPVVQEMADVIKKNPEMSRGEMARKYKSVFEEELAKSRAASPISEEPSPTLIKSTEGAKEVPKAKSLPAPKLVESIEEVRQALAQNFEDVYNADPVMTAKRKAGQLALREEFAKGKEIPSGPPIAMAGPVMEGQSSQVPQPQELQPTPAPITMPDFQTTNEIMDWAKNSTPTVENIEETYKLEDFYKNKYEQLRDSKDINGAIEAATKKQMFREAREHLLGTGSARNEPILEFPNVEELKSVGLGADVRGFREFSEANKLLEQLQLEALQEFGEPLDDLNVAKIGDEFHVIREEGPPEPKPLDLNEEVLDEIAPKETDEFTQAPPTKEEKAARAEARLEEIFAEIIKEQEERALEKAKAEKAREILESEDKIESTKELGLSEPLEPMESSERDYWEDILAAEGMKEELPLESDANDQETLDLGDDDYSRDLVDIINAALNERGSTTLGMGNLMPQINKLKRYLMNFGDKEPEIIKDIAELHLGGGFDVDLTYSTGSMWKNLPESIQPKIKFDYEPVMPGTIQANVAVHIPLEDNSVSSIMFDPPFLLNRGGNSKIVNRFSGMESTKALLEMHRGALKEAWRVLKPGGKIVVKLQDTIYGDKQVWSTEELYAAAIKQGFRPRDKVYYIGKSFGPPPNMKTQRHFKKRVSVFYVYEKPSRSYTHVDGSILESPHVKSGIDIKKVSNLAGVRLNSGPPVDLVGKIVKKALANRQPENPFTSTTAKWDVEYPFKKMGWPELGLAMKNRFSIMETYEKEGIRTIQALSDMRLGTKADYGRVALYNENPGDMTPEAKKHYGKAVAKVNKYLETWLQRFKDKGGLKRGFVENFKIRKKGHNYFLRQEIKKLKKARKPNEALIQEKWDKIKENNDIIKSMEGVHYTPLTTAWLDEMLEQRPVTLDKAFKIFAHTKRKVPTLKGLLELRDKNGRPVLTLEQIDIRDILARYARRSARDMAYLDIRNAALKDGAMTRKFKQGSGYTKIEANQLRMFKDLYAHRMLQEYLLEMTMAWQKGGKLHNIFALTKMAQFINPSFLAVYDVIQGAMTGVLTSVHTPKNFFKAWKEVKNFKSEYVNASLNGLFSQPINNVTSSWYKQVKNAMHPLATRLRRKALSEGFWPIEHVYNAAHEGAWLGDRFIRMISYLNLRDRGYSPKDAAQLAAKIHGDYASVPIEIRQKANWFMFTPTFKVVMGKLYYEMGKAALEFAVKPHTIFMEKGPNGKWGRTRLTQKHTMAMGLAMFMGFNMARDYMMQKAGYKRDKYGWKYYRRSNTSEGRREIVHTFSDPLALPFKYFWRIHDAFRPGPRTAIDNLIRSFRYEVHPFIAPWIFDLRENRTPDGKMIYSIVDTKPVKQLKMAEYLLRRYVRLYDVMVPSEATKERRKLMNKEFGRTMSILLSASVFSYVRKTRGERAVGKLQAIKRRVMRELMDTKKPYTREQLKNLNKMIKDVLKEGGY